MKITIYELLGMIKDGKAPKKIKYDNRFYTFDKKKDNYYEDETCSINWDYVSLHCLNEEVEILEEESRDINVCGSWFTKSEYDKLAQSEEEKKIPEKIDIYEDEEGHYFIDKHCKKIYITCDEINFMVEEFNQLIDYLKSKGE